MGNSAYSQLLANLDLLKLAQMKLHLDEVRDFVTTNGLSFTEGLLRLSNYEVDFKERNASRSMVKSAAFPFVKGLEDFDFGFQPSVNEQEMREFESLGFLEKNENIVFLGPSGVGKTHLATSIGVAAAKKRTSAYFMKCHDLLQQLKKAKLENRLDARIKHFCHYRLLVIDELGCLPIDKEDSNLFFQLVDARYEKKSTIVTTNMNFNEWDGVFYDAVAAGAIMDRILRHAHVVPISVKSYRLKDHLAHTDACCQDRKEETMRSLLEKIDITAYEKEEFADMLEDVLSRIQEIREEFNYELGKIEDMIMEM